MGRSPHRDGSPGVDVLAFGSPCDDSEVFHDSIWILVSQAYLPSTCLNITYHPAPQAA